MSCPDLCSSSTRTPKNINPDFKHKNKCPDFLAFSCLFLSTKHKHKSISSKNTNINLAADLLKPQNPDIQNLNSNPDFLIFQSTMKPPANKIHKPRNQIHKPRKFSIKTPLKKNHKVQSPHPQTQAKSFLSSFSVFVWLPRK